MNLFYTSSLSFNDIILEVKEVLEGTQGYILIQSTAKVILHMSSESQEDFVRNKRVIRVNPLIELLQTTNKFILHISTEFQRHVSGNKRVIRVNPWIDLVQTTTKVLLHISTEIQGHFLEIKELLEWTHGYIWYKAPPKWLYTSPLSS